MRRLILTLAILAFAALALPAEAGVRSCTTAMVDAGLCGATTDLLVHYSIPDAHQADFLAAWSEAANYQETVPCAEVRNVEGGVLVTAGPGDGTCTVELAGTEVANPQPRGQVVDAYLRRMLADEVRAWRVREAEEAARTDAQAAPDAEVNP